MRLRQAKHGPLPIYSFTQMEPQVSCTFCSAQFPERGSLDLHTMTEHGEMMQLLAEEHLGRRALLYSSSFSHVIFFKLVKVASVWYLNRQICSSERHVPYRISPKLSCINSKHLFYFVRSFKMSTEEPDTYSWVNYQYLCWSSLLRENQNQGGQYRYRFFTGIPLSLVPYFQLISVIIQQIRLGIDLLIPAS